MSDKTYKTPFSNPIDAYGHEKPALDPFFESFKKEQEERQERQRATMDNDAYRKMENNSRHHSHRKY